MNIDYKNRIFGLDVLRAIAILLVLFSHSTILLFPNQENIILTIIQFSGTIGVDLFFVLSGYLIGNIILKQLKKGNTKFKDFGYFWIRRWFRTLPNYFLILLLNILVVYLLKGEIINGLSSYFLFLQNFLNPHPDFFTEAWSLSIEEYAYIIGPLLLYILIFCFYEKSKSNLFLITVVIIITLVTCFKLYFHFNTNIISLEDWSRQLRKVVVYRIDSIYFGFLFASLNFNYSNWVNKFKYYFFSFGLLLFSGIHTIIIIFNLKFENVTLFYNIFYLPLVSISLLLFFPVFINWKRVSIFKNQITTISILSYGLYLINYSLVLLTIQHFVNIEAQSVFITLLLLVLYWLSSFVLAYLLYKFYEKPIMNFRENSFFVKRFLINK